MVLGCPLPRLYVRSIYRKRVGSGRTGRTGRRTRTKEKRGYESDESSDRLRDSLSSYVVVVAKVDLTSDQLQSTLVDYKVGDAALDTSMSRFTTDE